MLWFLHIAQEVHELIVLYSELGFKISAALPRVARSMFWLYVSRVEYTTRVSRPGYDVTKRDFICEDEVSTVSTDVASVVERWVLCFPFWDVCKPFTSFISYRV